MEDHTIVEGINGKGHFVGTSMAWGVNNNGWWGEGEIKFFMDGDGEFPTICGTGTEDYFGGAYDWDIGGRYTTYSTPYLGMHQVIWGGETYRANQRFSMYRWHVMDPNPFRAGSAGDHPGARLAQLGGDDGQGGAGRNRHGTALPSAAG